ncbi:MULTISPECIES: lasso RiPP family leader peptide-containing protein [Nocardiopsis]|nr:MULTISPECIES: lasso RiPP family leader peptide-containing protein [Nocardiopsis]
MQDTRPRYIRPVLTHLGEFKDVTLGGGSLPIYDGFVLGIFY